MFATLLPATTRMGELIRDVSDEALVDPTPCDIPLGALLDHIGTLTLAFTAAARRDFSTFTGPPPAPDAAKLGDDLRERIPRSLDLLASV